MRDVAQAVELAQKAVELAPASGMYWNTLGVAHYRNGEFQAAIKSLKKSEELFGKPKSHNWFFLAMAHNRLSEKDEARRSYERAVELMIEQAPDNEELLRFRAEAAELLEISNEQDVQKESAPSGEAKEKPREEP